MTTDPPAGACPVCQAIVPARPRPRGGRQSLYCSRSCQAKAYRSRLAATTYRTAAIAVPAGPDARHAAAVTARQQLTAHAAALADAASGQQTLLPATGATDAVVLTAACHDLIDQLAALAAAGQTPREAAPPRRPTRRPATVTPPLFDLTRTS